MSPEVSFLMENKIVASEVEANDLAKHVRLTEGDLNEVAREFFDREHLPFVPKHLRGFIDYHKFAEHQRMTGEFVEFVYEGKFYTCTNALAL